jgi:hypothetical protein
LEFDGLRQVFGNAGDHLWQLDLGGDVMDEVDEHRQVDQYQLECHGDREVRHVVTVIAGRDRYQNKDAVDERGHKRAQGVLGAAVADEIAQHPGPELGRRQCQRHDRDRKDDSHNGDDRARDRRQD